MIYVKNTPNNIGVAIHGDYMDMENLYKALHAVAKDDGECIEFERLSIRVLGVCYDIRHAMMGHREIEFVNNGMDEGKKRHMSLLTPDKNVYFKIYVLWPEMLFVTMVLNKFICLYAQKRAKKSYDLMLAKENIWDESIAMVRVLQAAIMKCIKETVSDASFRRMMNLVSKDYAWLNDYTRQYLDILNCRFIDMAKEKRLKNISIMAKKLVERGEEYKQVKAEIAAAAKHYNTYEDNIKPPVDYPEDFKW